MPCNMHSLLIHRSDLQMLAWLNCEARDPEQRLGMLAISPVTGSRWTAAVRPTPEDPFPVVYTALGEMWAMCLISWLLATPGSPACPSQR